MQALPKLHLVPNKGEIRESYKHIQITEKYIQATDGHIVVRYPTGFYIDLGVESKDPVDFAVEPKDWEKLTVKSVQSVIIDKDFETLTGTLRDGTKRTIHIVASSAEGFRFPAFDQVWPTESGDPVHQIGLASELLAKLCKVLAGPLRFKFFGECVAVEVTEITGSGRAIIMPCKIKS